MIPRVYKEVINKSGPGQLHTYVALRRHHIDGNKNTVETEVNLFSERVDPQDQLHLIEGTDSDTPENDFLRSFASNNKVLVVDPIVNPFSLEIAEKALVQELAPPAVFVLDELSLISRVQLERLSDNELEELFELSLERVSRAFNLGVQELKSKFLKLNFDDQIKLSKEVQKLYKIRQALVDKSNEESMVLVHNVLNRNPKKHIFAMSGAEHTEVFLAERPSLQKAKKVGSLTVFREGESINPLRQKLLAIQSALNFNQITLLAASSPFKYGGGLGESNWGMGCPASTNTKSEPPKTRQLSDLEKKHDRFLFDLRYVNPVDDQAIDELLRYVENAKPEEIPIWEPNEYAPPQRFSVDYTEGRLMKDCVMGDPQAHRDIFSRALGCTPEIISTRAVKGAKIFRIILEKIGDSLTNEIEVIKKLLSVPEVKASREGALATYSTSKHKWRNDSQKIWEIYNTARATDDAQAMRLVKLAMISADPYVLFSKFSDTDQYVIYEGKNVEHEAELVKCARESDQKIREKAFAMIHNYLINHDIENQFLVEALIIGIRSKDANALLATSGKLDRGMISDSRLLPLLIENLDDPDSTRRYEAFSAMGSYSVKGPVSDPRVKQFCRKYLNDPNDYVRISSTNLFGLLLATELKPESQPSDIQTLITLAKADKNDLVKSNAAYALAIIVNKNIDSLELEQIREVEFCCVNSRNPQVASRQELEIIDLATKQLITVSALQDLATVENLRGHDSYNNVARLVREKNRYRETIRTLWETIDQLHQANLELQTKVADLTSANKVLAFENSQLSTKVTELSQELERLKARYKNKHITRLTSTLGRTIVRNVVKGKGINTGDFAASVTVDTTWDEGIDLIGNIAVSGLLSYFGLTG